MDHRPTRSIKHIDVLNNDIMKDFTKQSPVQIMYSNGNYIYLKLRVINER